MNVTIDHAQTHLADLIARVARGESVVITDDDKPVAQIVQTVPPKPQPQFGRGRGMLEILAEDDEHLKDFEEYMP